MQVLRQQIPDFNDYQIHSMNNIQSKDRSISQGKKQWAMQEKVTKAAKNFSLLRFVGGGEGKLRCDVKTEGGISLLKCMQDIKH